MISTLNAGNLGLVTAVLAKVGLWFLGIIMGYVMVWAQNEGFCNFEKV
jgi:hypothetical protein